MYYLGSSVLMHAKNSAVIGSGEAMRFVLIASNPPGAIVTIDNREMSIFA